MATFKADIAERQDDLRLDNRISGVEATGQIRFLEATYTTTGTEAATGDTIEIADLPIGAVPLPEYWGVGQEASMGGSDGALPKIGDSGDDDRYSATSIAIHASNSTYTRVTPAAATSVVKRHVIDKDTQRIIATFSRTNALTAGKKIKFVLAFRLP